VNTNQRGSTQARPLVSSREWPLAAEEQANDADPARSPHPPANTKVPTFPHTPDGRAGGRAYYEAHKLNNPPNSLLGYNDAKRGLEPPAERRARERRDERRPR
jgi:hypothetical protein